MASTISSNVISPEPCGAQTRRRSAFAAEDLGPHELLENLQQVARRNAAGFRDIPALNRSAPRTLRQMRRCKHCVRCCPSESHNLPRRAGSIGTGLVIALGQPTARIPPRVARRPGPTDAVSRPLSHTVRRDRPYPLGGTSLPLPSSPGPARKEYSALNRLCKGFWKRAQASHRRADPIVAP